MSGLEARRGLTKKVEPRLNENLEPAAVTRGFGDLLVRVADAFEVELPFGLRAIGQALGFAGDSVDIATCCANLVDDAAAHIAPQLGATRWSPKAAIEEDDREVVAGERETEPSAARAGRRIEFGLALGFVRHQGLLF